MNEKIIIYRKGGHIYAKGYMSEDNRYIAIAMIRHNNVTPSMPYRLKRTMRKFFRALKYALTPTATPKEQHITVSLPVLYEVKK